LNFELIKVAFAVSILSAIYVTTAGKRRRVDRPIGTFSPLRKNEEMKKREMKKKKEKETFSVDRRGTIGPLSCKHERLAFFGSKPQY